MQKNQRFSYYLSQQKIVSVYQKSSQKKEAAFKTHKSEGNTIELFPD